MVQACFYCVADIYLGTEGHYMHWVSHNVYFHQTGRVAVSCSCLDLACRSSEPFVANYCWVAQLRPGPEQCITIWLLPNSASMRLRLGGDEWQKEAGLLVENFPQRECLEKTWQSNSGIKQSSGRWREREAALVTKSRVLSGFELFSLYKSVQ